MAKERVLIVDDEKMIRWSLAEALRGWDYTPVEADSVSAALAALDADTPDVVLLDINLPDGSGLDVMRLIKARGLHTIVILMTGNVILEDTLAAVRGGAYDFIAKPLNLDELRVAIRNGIETLKLRNELGRERSEKAKRFSFDQIIGESPVIQEILHLARRVAESEASSVLLIGESGTGKDLIAQAIHYASRRASGPFVAINCAAIPPTLIESELFGYEKGAFTDAKTRKSGLFEQAEGGTIFLDEIGEIDLSLQAKLLRVLEEGAVRRLGAVKDIPLDVRILAASNRDLRAESETGHFRLDLYYRLAVIQIDIPPLRDRGDDVLIFARHYVDKFAARSRRKFKGLSPEVERVFRAYSWPGNVRELRNVIERATLLEESDVITARYLPPGLVKTAVHGPASELDRPGFVLPPEGISLEEVEMSFVRQALEMSGGNQTRAAELLGITRDQLRYRMKKIEQEPEAVSPRDAVR